MEMFEPGDTVLCTTSNINFGSRLGLGYMVGWSGRGGGAAIMYILYGPWPDFRT